MGPNVTGSKANVSRATAGGTLHSVQARGRGSRERQDVTSSICCRDRVCLLHIHSPQPPQGWSRGSPALQCTSDSSYSKALVCKLARNVQVIRLNKMQNETLWDLFGWSPDMWWSLGSCEAGSSTPHRRLKGPVLGTEISRSIKYER